MFLHPGQLAFVAAIVAGIYCWRLIAYGVNRNILWLAVALVILLLTLERQEIVAVAVLLPSLTLMTRRSHILGERFVLGSLTLIGATVVLLPLLSVLSNYVRFVATRLELAAVGSSQAARVVFYVFGYQLANERFPLGVGFGSFGGYAAKVFDSPYYSQLGFSSFSWYREGMYLTDTFWPHVYAEAGWFGFTAYVIALGALVVGMWYAFRNSRYRESRMYARTSLFSILFLLSVSLTSATPTSMLPVMLSFMFLYMANPTPAGRPIQAAPARSSYASR